MKLLPLRQAESAVLKAIKSGTPQTLVLATFKRDRSLTVTIAESADSENAGEKGAGLTVVIETKGYENATHAFADVGEARHAFKKACAREFPRSHKVYVS